MTVFTTISEMTLAVEGARGPPTAKKRELFTCNVSAAMIRHIQ